MGNVGQDPDHQGNAGGFWRVVDPFPRFQEQVEGVGGVEGVFPEAEHPVVLGDSLLLAGPAAVEGPAPGGAGHMEVGLGGAALGRVGEDDGLGPAPRQPGHVLLGRLEGLHAVVARAVSGGPVPIELGRNEGLLAEKRLSLPEVPGRYESPAASAPDHLNDHAEVDIPAAHLTGSFFQTRRHLEKKRVLKDGWQDTCARNICR